MTFCRRVAAAMTCFVNDIFCHAIQLGYCLPRLSSVGKDYGLARRAKRVLACAVVRLLLFNQQLDGNFVSGLSYTRRRRSLVSLK
jgi:hypothetical protein